MALITKLTKKTKSFYLEHRVSKSLGSDQTKIHGNINFDTSKLATKVSYAHKCIIISSRCNVGTKANW
jgi:hypothetical protein